MVFGYGEGPFAPVAIREAEGDVIGKAIILEEEPEILATGGLIDIIRAAPTEDFIPTFGEDAFVALFIGPVGELVVVSELGVAKDFGRDAE